jgi:hypothetical protein
LARQAAAEDLGAPGIDDMHANGDAAPHALGHDAEVLELRDTAVEVLCCARLLRQMDRDVEAANAQPPMLVVRQFAGDLGT